MATTCTPIGLAVGSLTPPNQPVSCDPVFLAVGARTPVPPPPPAVIAGTPGSFVNMSVPADYAALQNDPDVGNAAMSGSPAWGRAEYVLLGDGSAASFGGTWRPATVVAPGYAGDTDPSLNYWVPDPPTAWTTGQQAAAYGAPFHWDGSGWVAGAAP